MTLPRKTMKYRESKVVSVKTGKMWLTTSKQNHHIFQKHQKVTQNENKQNCIIRNCCPTTSKANSALNLHNHASFQSHSIKLTARPLTLKLLSHRTFLRRECIAGQSQALGLAVLSEKGGRGWANEFCTRKETC